MSTSTVTVHDAARVPHFEEVFGSATVPVKSIIPFWAELPIGRTLVFELDVDALDEATRARLVRHLAGKFGIPLAEANALLRTEGLPILAESCTTMTNAMDFL